MVVLLFFVFFSSRRRHTRCLSDWSSDVCSSDLYRTNEDYIADMDPKTGAIKLYALKKAVEVVEDPVHEMTLGEARRIDSKVEIGGEVRIPKNTDALGRISAQTAKQVIFQKVREAERDTVFQEYS